MNYIKVLEELLEKPNFTEIEELLNEHNLASLVSYEDNIRVLIEIRIEHDDTTYNTDLLLQILIIYNAFQKMRYDFVKLILDPELVLGTIWVLINPDLFLF